MLLKLKYIYLKENLFNSGFKLIFSLIFICRIRKLFMNFKELKIGVLNLQLIVRC